MKYLIQSNIPIPPRRQRDPNSFSSKLRELKKGQSIYRKGASGDAVNAAANRVMGAGNYAIRTVNGGVRVWRIK